MYMIPLFTLGSIYSTYNPIWPEANQLAIYKHDRGFELGTTKNKSS